MDVKEIEYFSRLPVEIVLKILSFLTGNDLLNITLVSKTFEEIATEDFLWRIVLNREGVSSEDIDGMYVQESAPYFKQFIKYKHHKNKWLKNDCKKDVIEDVQTERIDGHMLAHIFGVSTDFFIKVNNFEYSMKIWHISDQPLKYFGDFELKEKVSKILIYGSLALLIYSHPYSVYLHIYCYHVDLLTKQCSLLYTKLDLILSSSHYRGITEDILQFSDLLFCIHIFSVSVYHVRSNNIIFLKRLTRLEDDINPGIGRYNWESTLFCDYYIAAPWWTLKKDNQRQIHCWSIQSDKCRILHFTSSTNIVQTARDENVFIAVSYSQMFFWSVETWDLVMSVKMEKCIREMDVSSNVQIDFTFGLLLAPIQDEFNTIGVFDLSGSLVGRIYTAHDMTLKEVMISHHKVYIQARSKWYPEDQTYVADLSVFHSALTYGRVGLDTDVSALKIRSVPHSNFLMMKSIIIPTRSKIIEVSDKITVYDYHV
eukprot:GFUD01012031.1.p1 GENE.GFUD01012031.1~~GFUD01012031.1.p1  ORF type:complete len:499 (-),score=57.78 GFUD01012031.1:282-1730(-)